MRRFFPAAAALALALAGCARTAVPPSPESPVRTEAAADCAWDVDGLLTGRDKGENVLFIDHKGALGFRSGYMSLYDVGAAYYLAGNVERACEGKVPYPVSHAEVEGAPLAPAAPVLVEDRVARLAFDYRHDFEDIGLGYGRWKRSPGTILVGHLGRLPTGELGFKQENPPGQVWGRRDALYACYLAWKAHQDKQVTLADRYHGRVAPALRAVRKAKENALRELGAPFPENGPDRRER
jgi:hypothetical protein